VKTLDDTAGARENVTTSPVPTLPDRIVRRVRRAGRYLLDRLETRRAAAIRRRPAPLARRLWTARSALILCQGNVSRSVFAANVLAAALKDSRTLSIRSAGLGTEPGWRAHPRVITRCQALGIDIRGHASVAVTVDMVRQADVVFVMEVAQLVDMTRRFFEARRKTFLLTSLAPDVPMDIADPAGKPDAEVDACMDHVARALDPVIEIFVRRGSALA
jgi:protein-tyrosine-phosphatase